MTAFEEIMLQGLVIGYIKAETFRDTYSSGTVSPKD